MARGLFVHTSNRLEELLEALATVLADEPLPPLQDDVVAVPSQGLARWLRLRLAERFGVAGSLRLPFLGSFFAALGRPESAARDPLARDELVFRCWRILRDPDATRELAAPVGYCRDDPDDGKRLQLCLRLARVFDDYQVYRPDLLQRWSDGDDTPQLGLHAPWQARLWRRLLRDAGFVAAAAAGRPRARQRASPGPLLFPELAAPAAAPEANRQPIQLLHLRQQLADPAFATAALPPRLSVFGAGTLPPMFLELLAAISAHVPVHLYVPEPAALEDPDSDNPWLASFGQQAREFAALRAALDERDLRLHRFDLPDLAGRMPARPPGTLLQHLQQEIADLEPPAAGREPFRIAPDDASFRVHDCHSPQRELEVVRDQILAAFAADPGLRAHDVFVLVPDVETYAPIARAVFGPVAEHLPFHVADRSPVRDQPICSTLFALLQLAVSRCEVQDVFRILEEPAVHRRFGLFAGDLPILRERVEQAGIRWGLDADHRARTCHIPAFDDHAWQPGLHRLLLGVATGPVDDLVLGVLPVGDTTSSRDETLARFLTFFQTLWREIEPCARPHPLGAWADHLDRLVAAMFAPGNADDDAAIAHLRAATARLRHVAAATGLVDTLSPAVLRDWLDQALQQSASARGFLAGAVTVAALLPMRTVPARHLFVCGLDDASFPRRPAPLAFDLIAQHRRPGDRDPRSDDRQLLLDVLLAAREALHLTFVGHSQKDDSECAPSVLLAELLDHCDRVATADDDRPARTAIVLRHPLQPWSGRYRDGRDARLFTFSRAQLPALLARLDDPPWFTDPLVPPPDLDGPELPLDRLLEFWKHPPRFFLKVVCGIQVRGDDEPEATTEPFGLDSLDKWRIQDVLVRRAGRRPTAEGPADRLAIVRAHGLLPPFGHGDLAFTELDDETQAFLLAQAHHGPRSRKALRVAIDGLVVTGDVDGVTAEMLVRARMANLKPKDRLAALLVHLAVAVARGDGDATWPARTLALGKDRSCTFRPLDRDTAVAWFLPLLRGYRAGLREPLPFFAETSEQWANGGLAAARAAWRPSQPKFPPESADFSNELCFRGRDPLELPAFAEWAKAVFEAIGATEEPS